MSSKWKANLPREAPIEGKAHFVFAVKNDNGRRGEFSGQIPNEVAGKIMLMIIEAMGKQAQEAKSGD